jgi:hypothetical protein
LDLTANVYGISFGNDENVLKVDGDDGCTICKYTENY